MWFYKKLNLRKDKYPKNADCLDSDLEKKFAVKEICVLMEGGDIRGWLWNCMWQRFLGGALKNYEFIIKQRELSVIQILLFKAIWD